MFEYMCRSFEPRDVECVTPGWSVLDLQETQDWLNRLAGDGWRLLQVLCIPERRPDDRSEGDERQLIYYFERPIKS